MTIYDVPLRTQVYEIEAAVPIGTPASAPLSVDLILGAPIIKAVNFYCNVNAALGAAYWRVLHQGEVLIPGGTAQAINAAVPGGWMASPLTMFYPLQIQLPQGPSYRITAQFINTTAAILNVTLDFYCAFISDDQMQLEIINRLDILKDLKGS